VKNRPQCKDIPDEVILEACDHYHAELKTWRFGHYVHAERKERVAGSPLSPDERLADRWPPKLILAKMEGMHRRGLIEYGVSLRTAWRKTQ